MARRREGAAQTVAEQPGLTTFANFFLLPWGEEVTAMFQYQLPAGVTQTENGDTIYRLTVYKQPGTRPEQLTLAITLPAGATLLDSSLPATESEGRLIMNTTLESNLEILLRYR